MTVLTVRHKVKSFPEWKKVFDDHRPVREKAGLKDIRLERSVDAENDLLVTMEVSDLEKARAFAESEDLKKTMQKGGVLAPPEVFIGDTV